MELDDLRRRWQQSAPSEPILDDKTVRLLLARRSGSPVAKMRRNVWLEIGIAVAFVLLAASALREVKDGHTQAMLVWMLIMCLLSGFYFRRKLAVLRSLNDSAGALREHVARQLSSLRGLVQLYYRATMWSLPITFGIGLFFIGSKLAQELSGQKLLLGLGILVAFYAFVGLLGYFFMRWFTRWYLQKLYGQHLDRLEALLKELEE
ncbi:hypothetical protein [Hymenobacter weizhouensis]|uniref:hypothetical protein n=1 Tax=Hymenobacter sp. YIM 151500-1 TaxID=2987689 RepID=UPI0022269BFE|nr:hypothetical protein [Hymenobacter sp. YIM 151500-1]UYZ65165.1 hypothetical protein OIS53_10015 [Hymenobacter sp. YIM 151500-1]